jgi:Fe-S cluster biogenesis protein NfuA
MTKEIKITAYPGNVDNICLFVIENDWKVEKNFFVDKANQDDVKDISLLNNLFQIVGVIEIMGRENTLTLKKDHISNWKELGPHIGHAIRSSISQDKGIIPEDLDKKLNRSIKIDLGGKNKSSNIGINHVPTYSQEEMKEIPLDDEKAIAVKTLLTDQINPALASHGGKAELVGMSQNKVFLVLGGGCQGCGMASQTLKQGIGKAIKEKFTFVKEVVDTTDHMSGSNPYYN